MSKEQETSFVKCFKAMATLERMASAHGSYFGSVVSAPQDFCTAPQFQNTRKALETMHPKALCKESCDNSGIFKPFESNLCKLSRTDVCSKGPTF